jgi:hypothetical protein
VLNAAHATPNFAKYCHLLPTNKTGWDWFGHGPNDRSNRARQQLKFNPRQTNAKPSLGASTPRWLLAFPSKPTKYPHPCSVAATSHAVERPKFEFLRLLHDSEPLKGAAGNCRDYFSNILDDLLQALRRDGMATSSAEGLILNFKPGNCVLQVLRIKIWPIFITDIKIRINRLHREKAAQTASTSPTYNQIQA